MTLDAINGTFELGAFIALSRNVWLTYKAKEVKGISVLSMSWFCAWGYFNCLYYPSLHQTFSFYMGALVALINTFWIGQILFYKRGTMQIQIGGSNNTQVILNTPSYTPPVNKIPPPPPRSQFDYPEYEDLQ